MKILIIGEQQNFEEFQAKFGTEHEYVLVGEHHDAEKFLQTQDLIFDFIIDQDPGAFEIYVKKDIVVFLNTCKISLGELAHSVDNKIHCTMYGFNGLPSLLNRHFLECSLFRGNGKDKLNKLSALLKTELLVVEDRVGLVTPRVISMIINEAFYALQEGTANRSDIDLAMKLGTNYPYGPFEWSERIGIKHVYELLESLYDDTKDERYKICPLLKQHYLQAV